MCVCVAKPVAVELRCHATALIDWIFFILAGNEDNYKSLDEFNFGRIPPLTSELVALECLKKKVI